MSSDRGKKALLISLFAILCGFLFGLLIVAVAGYSPQNMMVAMIKALTGFDCYRPYKGINIKIVLDLLYYSTPIILTGLSVAFAYRTGLFNIGCEGQFLMGYLAATLCAFLKLPPIIHPLVCIIAAIIAGSLWAFLPGFLKAYRGINEVVICIMMNYIGLYFSNFITMNTCPLSDSRKTTIDFLPSALLHKISPTPSSLNTGLFLALFAIFVYYFIIEKTTFGFSLRATGFNAEGARYAGMKTKRNIVLSMMISGGFTGLCAAIVCLGSFKYGRVFAGFDNYGFTGIAVALVGSANAIGVGLAGLLFGYLKSCGNFFQINKLPSELSEIVQAIIVFMVAIQYVFNSLLFENNNKFKNSLNFIKEKAKKCKTTFIDCSGFVLTKVNKLIDKVKKGNDKGGFQV